MPRFAIFTELTTGHPKPVATQEGAGMIVLQALNETTKMLRIDTFASASAAYATGQEVFRCLFTVNGAWAGPPAFAVSSRWRVQETGRAGEFVERWRRLFELHRVMLPTLAFDWLLQSLAHGSHYRVLGGYGDEAGATRLWREHPDILQFMQMQPVLDNAAAGVDGAQTFRIDKFVPV